MSTASYLSLVGSGNLDWIDERFERAVDIIQSLPKSGPIHSDYGQKLTLYGKVISPLPVAPRSPLTSRCCRVYKQGTHYRAVLHSTR